MRFSLRKKTTVLIVSIVLLISIVSILACGKIIRDIIRTQYSDYSSSLSSTVAVTVDAERVTRLRDQILAIYDSAENKVSSTEWGTDEFYDYLALFRQVEQTEDFMALRHDLRLIQDVNDVDCIYLDWVDAELENVIYLVDAAYEDVCPPGCIDPLYAGTEILHNPEIGFPPYLTNTAEYGWLVSAGAPIHNLAGEIVGYACVDISMNEMMHMQHLYLTITALALLLLAVVVSFGGIVLVNRFIVRPINALSDASVGFNGAESGDCCSLFADLNIHTGDEIEALAGSMAQMEKNIKGYIDSLFNMSQELSVTRERADEMGYLANVDALTKVRNKRAFDLMCDRLKEEIQTGKAAFGLAMVDLNDLKKFNDNYGHDKGDLAIQELCGLICTVFKHSAVFRLGGDEFAVVLENQDYRKSDRLIDTLYRGIRARQADESLPPWQRISAALGYAAWDPALDDTLDDLLKRADQAMYERKKAMKAEAAAHSPRHLSPDGPESEEPDDEALSSAEPEPKHLSPEPEEPEPEETAPEEPEPEEAEPEEPEETAPES